MSVTILYDESAKFYADLFARSITLKDGFNIDGGSLGSVLYNDGTKYVQLPAGTFNQVLTIGGGGIPIWSTGAGATVPDPLTLTKLFVGALEDPFAGAVPIDIFSDVLFASGKKLSVDNIESAGASTLTLNTPVTINGNITVTPPSNLTIQEIDLVGTSIFSDATTNLGANNLSVWYFENGIKSIATGSNALDVLRINATATGLEWAPETTTIPDPLTVNNINAVQKLQIGDNLNTDQEILEFNKGGGNYLVRYDDNLDGSGGAGIIFTSTQPISTQYCFAGSHASPGATQLRIDNNSASDNGQSVWAQGLYPTPLSVANSRRITSTVNGTANTWALDVAQHLNPVQNFITGTFDSSPSQLSSFEAFSIGAAGLNTGIDIVMGTATNYLASIGHRVNVLTTFPVGGNMQVLDNMTISAKDLNIASGRIVMNSTSTLLLAPATIVKDDASNEGSIWYFNASRQKVVLPKGNADEILTMNSSGTAPEWRENIQTHKSFGNIFLTNGAVVINFSAPNTPTPLLGTTTINSLSQDFSSPSPQVIRYDSLLPKKFLVIMDVSFEAGFSGQKFNFEVFKFGSSPGLGKATITPSDVDEKNVSYSTILELTLTDTLQIYVSNESGTNPIVLRESHITVYEL